MKDEIKEKIKNGFKLGNKAFILILLLSPFLLVLFVFAVPFGALAFIFKSYFDFKKEYRIIKQKHERSIKTLNFK